MSIVPASFVATRLLAKPEAEGFAPLLGLRVGELLDGASKLIRVASDAIALNLSPTSAIRSTALRSDDVPCLAFTMPHCGRIVHAWLQAAQNVSAACALRITVENKHATNRDSRRWCRLWQQRRRR